MRHSLLAVTTLLVIAVVSLVGAQEVVIDAGAGVNPPTITETLPPPTPPAIPIVDAGKTVEPKASPTPDLPAADANGRVLPEEQQPKVLRERYGAKHSSARHSPSIPKTLWDYRHGKTKDQQTQWSAISTAQRTANEAYDVADDAQNAADEAKETANDAKKRVEKLEERQIPWWGWLGIIAFAAVAALAGKSRLSSFLSRRRTT